MYVAYVIIYLALLRRSKAVDIISKTSIHWEIVY